MKAIFLSSLVNLSLIRKNSSIESRKAWYWFRSPEYAFGANLAGESSFFVPPSLADLAMDIGFCFGVVRLWILIVSTVGVRFSREILSISSERVRSISSAARGALLSSSSFFLFHSCRWGVRSEVSSSVSALISSSTSSSSSSSLAPSGCLAR